ncbi:ROK family transcriptional regulator [Sphingomonas sp. PL20]|uniref:ROK family transcriptional regulator n=1 Tax=Sphingomonas sp. PL20 TaxID=2760712 RepID=UPI001AE2A5E8
MGSSDLSASERVILQAIWRNAPITRSDLAERTGFGVGSITRLVRELEERELVMDVVERTGARGQPSRPVSLRPDGAFACGVYFSHSYVDVGLIDLAGELRSSERIRIARPEPETIAEAARAGMLRQVAALEVPLDRIVGVGFALPGDFGDTTAALRAHAYFPELLNRDLAAEFGARMPVPVFVENDAASAALGERVNGIGRRLDSFVLVHIGHGVGGGLVLGRRLFRGSHGNAGVIGVLYPPDRERPSGQDLFETLERSGVAVGDFDTLEQLDPATCPPLRQWLDRAGAQLASGIHTAARLLDPDAIILGGRLPPHLLAALLAAIDLDAAFHDRAVLPVPQVALSSLGPYAGVIGAASICMFATFFDERPSRAVSP